MLPVALSTVKNLSLGNLFEKNVHRFPDKVVQVFEDGTKQTYGELNERANRLANGLLGLGLKKGDHVAWVCNNCMEFMEFHVATTKVGMVSVMVNNFMPKERIAFMLKHSDSKAVFYESQYQEVIDFSRKDAPDLKQFICIDRGQPVSSDCLRYEEIIAQSPDNAPDVIVNPEDPNSMLFTTGTTGNPKAVLKNQIADILYAINIFYNPYRDLTHKFDLPAYAHFRILLIPPQFHLGGYSISTIPLVFPGTLVVVRGYDAEKMLKLIDREKVHTTWVQPAMLYEIQRLPREVLDKYDVSSVIGCLCGGSALKEQEALDMRAFFHNAEVCSTYAATEIGWISIVNSHELAKTKPNCLGLPCAFGDWYIGDEEGRELPVGEIGLIWVSTPSMPVNFEYYKDPEATSKTFKNGWVAVGDLGYQDEEGNIYYCGRADDVIKSGGEKVSPLTIEEVLQQHPKVNSVAVVGIPDAKWQELVAAAVVLQKGETCTPEELIDYCRGKVANYEVPKKVVLLDALPLGTTGKVDRKQTRELLISLEEAATSTSD